MCVYMYIYVYTERYIYIYIYTYIGVCIHSGPHSSVVRAGAQVAEALGSSPAETVRGHTTEPIEVLSGVEVSPLKVSGGSPVHLRSKHQVLVGKTRWVKKI